MDLDKSNPSNLDLDWILILSLDWIGFWNQNISWIHGFGFKGTLDLDLDSLTQIGFGYGFGFKGTSDLDLDLDLILALDWI